MGRTLEERFWEKVDQGGPDECWEWAASTNNGGYGQFWVGDRSVVDGAHRVSVRLSGREIPEGLQVNHTCDNPSCVNPQHLRIGTQSENIRDAYERGGLGTEEGHSRGNVELTREEVADIKARDTGTQREIAEEFGVSQALVCGIKNGERWPHVEATTTDS